VFRLSNPGDVALAQSALHLTMEEAGPIPELGLGRAVWKAGEGAAVLVQHRIGPHEWVFCDGPRALAV
jgi:hypothetical protein